MLDQTFHRCGSSGVHTREKPGAAGVERFVLPHYDCVPSFVEMSPREFPEKKLSLERVSSVPPGSRHHNAVNPHVYQYITLHQLLSGHQFAA